MTEFAMTINGANKPTSSSFDVIDPASSRLVARCPSATSADLDCAIEAANAAFPAWAATPDADRRAAIGRMADLIALHAEDLAQLLTREQGKPLNGVGSRFELGGAQAWTRYVAALELPVEVVQNTPAGRVEVHRRPLGVVGSITPWNWPLMIAIWHIMPAIRAGNCVVIKPSPLTPLSTLRLVELLAQELPAGVLNCITGPDSLGQGMAEHSGIHKIVFTGSIATGRRVMASAAPTLKRLTLELGGNDAAIVLPDADPAVIAEGLYWGAFINNGQTCAAIKRLYVHDSIYDEVSAALCAFADGIPMGDGSDETTLQGPVQNRRQFDRVAALVDGALADGARLLRGGRPVPENGLFYPATVIADARDGMAIVDEEQFGPALPIIRYHSVDDVIARANALEYGLGGSVWSADVNNAVSVAAQLECGSVWVNKHGAIQPDAPFGGVKASGFGVEFGRQGLEEMTSIQTMFR